MAAEAPLGGQALHGSAGSRLAFPPKAVFSSGTDMTDRIVPLKDTAKNKSFNMSFDHSMARYTDTDSTTDTDNTSRPNMGRH